jgi:hypothetical protein
MGMIQRETSTAPPADFEITHPLRPVLLAGVLSLVLFAIGSIIIFRIFAPALLEPAWGRSSAARPKAG